MLLLFFPIKTFLFITFFDSLEGCSVILKRINDDFYDPEKHKDPKHRKHYGATCGSISEDLVFFHFLFIEVFVLRIANTMLGMTSYYFHIRNFFIVISPQNTK